MRYDTWKATNPADEWLDFEPEQPFRCPVCGCEVSADETPCEGLEYGYTCGIALLQKGGAE
jgi:hypothetical protein